MFAGHVGAFVLGRYPGAAGMTVAPPPPSVAVMAASSLVAIAVVTALTSWIGRA